MATVVNIKQFINNQKALKAKLQDKEYLLRPVVADLIVLMHERIHEQGIASDGAAIGTYSDDYLALRQKKFKRNADSKVIVSLTRQLENDYAIVPTQKGYGIGFKNSHNKDKAGWVEETKGRIIFNLTKDEENYVADKLQKLITQAINDTNA